MSSLAIYIPPLVNYLFMPFVLFFLLKCLSLSQILELFIESKILTVDYLVGYKCSPFMVLSFKYIVFCLFYIREKFGLDILKVHMVNFFFP